MKKTLAFFLSLALVISLLPMAALASGATEVSTPEGLTAALEDSNVTAITITGGTYTSEISVPVGKTLVINGGTFTNFKLIGASGDGVTINDCTFSGTAVAWISSVGNVVINGGTFDCSAIGMTDSDSPPKVIINGGNFNIKSTISPYDMVEIHSGTFSVDPTSFLANTEIAIQKDDSNCYVVGSTAAAKIGNVEYASLQDALDAAKNGDTIVLYKDGESATISNNLSVNLENGTSNNMKVTINGKDIQIATNGTYDYTYRKPIIFIPVIPSEPEIEVTVSGSTATITVPEELAPAVVEIPYENAEGLVVKDAKTGEIIPFGIVTEEGIKVLLKESCTLELINNDRNFTDIDGHWAEPFINFVTERELYDGMTATTFGPEYKMTQAMLIVVLAGMDGNEASGSDWYTWAVEWGIENDIFTVKDTTTEMTRENFALMLFNYAKKLSLDTTIRADLSVFPDADEISTANLTAMQWAVAADLMDGRTDGTIDPTASATRAEVAVMLMQFIYYAVS